MATSDLHGYRMKSLIGGAALLLFIAVQPAAGATFTWNGDGADNNWSTPDNWVGDAAPGNPAADDDLVFSGATDPNPVVDAAWSGVQSISFSGATTPFTLSGEAITFSATGTITNPSASNQYFNNDIIGGATALNIIVGGPSVIYFNDPFDLSAGGDLNITPTAGNVGINSTISGAAAALNVGAGVGWVILESTNTYGGGTNVTGGNVLIRNNSALGTGAVDMNGGNTLRFDINGGGTVANDIVATQSFTLSIYEDVQLDGALTGGGTITRQGAGTVLTLAGDGSGFTGDFINDTANGAVMLDNSGGGSDGTLGDGTITFTNDEDAILMGNGTIGGDLDNDGVVAPGASVGQINVTGDYDQSATGVLDVELNRATGPFPLNTAPPPADATDSYDVLNVTGTATFADGADIEVSALGKGYIADGDEMAIVQTDGGVTATPANLDVISNVTFFDFDVALDGSGDMLVLTADRLSYTTATNADTHNRRQVALGLDSLAGATPQGDNADDREVLLAEMDFLGDSVAFGQALDYLSPERYDILDRVHRRNTQAFAGLHEQYFHTRRMGMGTSNEEIVRTQSGPKLASLDENPMLLAQASDEAEEELYTRASRIHRPSNPDERFGMFFNSFYMFNDEDDLDDRSGFDADTLGFNLGIDWQINENLLAGLVFGYANTDVEFGGLDGDADVDTFRFGAYMSYDISDRWYLDGVLSYGYHRHESTRPVLVGSLDMRNADAAWNGHDVSVWMSTGYDLLKDEDMQLVPSVGLHYIHFYQESYEEEGAMAMNLTTDGQNTDSLETKLGGRFAMFFRGESWTLIPEVSVAWRYDFLADGNDDITARFSAAPDTFDIQRGESDTSALELGGGINVLCGDAMSLYIRYEGAFYDEGTAHSIGGGLTIRF